MKKKDKDEKEERGYNETEGGWEKKSIGVQRSGRRTVFPIYRLFAFSLSI